jgi:hypothetical protein
MTAAMRVLVLLSPRPAVPDPAAPPAPESELLLLALLPPFRKEPGPGDVLEEEEAGGVVLSSLAAADGPPTCTRGGVCILTLVCVVCACVCEAVDSISFRLACLCVVSCKQQLLEQNRCPVAKSFVGERERGAEEWSLSRRRRHRGSSMT